MTRARISAVVIALMVAALAAPHTYSQPKSAIAEKTAGMELRDGFFPYFWDAKTGKVWLRIDRWDTEFLYMESLPAGVGSNDIGLDRGQIGSSRIVKFQRIGPKVLLVEPNYSYRAVTDDTLQRNAVEESFAKSVLWGFEVAAEEGTAVLVDATSFFLADAHDVAGTLRRTNQGGFRLDPGRSAFYLPRMKNFPDNTEIEATLTFAGDEPGGYLQSVVPTPQAVTVREHHSLIKLPDDGYKPRVFDPRAGYFPTGYFDYATPIDQPIEKLFLVRHRLAKKNPAAPVSDPVKPIVYYIDPSAPEPIRSALTEGASWWNQAFEAAGYRNAFQVKLLPPDADPMDVRYNMVEWVHRSTRGWSYGNAISDPRTGEIIKGHVSLGSLRVRQDFLIAEGLIADYEAGKPIDPRMEQMALARIRQLAAHEVGHTLGLSHNYIASSVNRASVMDYPAPFAILGNDGNIDLTNAYAKGIGEWDKVSIAFGYQDFPAGTDEQAALNDIITSAASRGLTYLTDQDARPQGSAHPRTHLWDNGTDAVEELARVMAVRKTALERFSEKSVRPGMPLAKLEDVLVPVYLGHRYQVEATAKVIGGLEYTYAVRGDGQVPTRMIPADVQRKALSAVLATLAPEALTLPDRINELIPPRPAGYDRGREHFHIHTGLTFDPLSAAEAAANLPVALILNPARVSRLVEYHSRDPKLPGADEVIEKLLGATWYSPRKQGLAAEVQHVVESSVLFNLLGLGANASASVGARAAANQQIHALSDWIFGQMKLVKDPSQRDHLRFAADQIAVFWKDPKALNLPRPADAPDGSPIGGDIEE